MNTAHDHQFMNRKMVTETTPQLCACYEYVGDNPRCPIHGKPAATTQLPADRDNADILRAARAAGFPNARMARKPETMTGYRAQLRDAGFGDGGIF